MEERIQGFLQAADQVTLAYWQRNGFTYAPSPVHRAEYISDKWCKVVTVENGRVTCVYAFIALKDNETRALGKVKAGDIHKAASYKVPAKHARGSVFASDFGASCLDSHGPHYLR